MDYFGENKPVTDFGRRSLRGGMVSVGARAITALVHVISMLILARLLTPEDYGLVGMVTAIIGVAPLLIDLGTRDAVVQQRHITPEEISALFWMTFGLGCGFAALAAASGPLIAHFYGEPRLSMVAFISSLSLIPLALSYQHHGLLCRAMKYHELAVINISASVISTAIAIAFAFQGWAYWALVVRPVVLNIVTTLGVWCCCRWLPGRPAFTPGVKQMVKFGINWLGFSAPDFAGKFADRIAVGYANGATALGYYQKACLVYENSLDLVTTPLTSVAMAGLSKLRHDPEKLVSSWSKALSTIAFVAMPAFGLLTVTGRDIIILALGEKWAAASILLCIFALRGIPHVVERTCGWLHNAAGRADRLMRWGVISNLSLLIALFAGLPFGATGVAWALVLSTYLLVVPAIVYSGQPLGIGIGSVLAAVGPQTIGALAACAISFAMRETVLAQTDLILRTVLLGVFYLAMYVTIVLGVFRVRTPLRVGQSLFRAYAG
jgi:PST family polysaccharide transporter